ncbi:conserved hypothetical protein [Candidatus Methylobacter favarea]|uniref:Uncharacterized protein n=1 Tax=Candidatus Methylobacter favarea TaxID=2707345 RepID=A0A8S0WBJ8_9GAMM|nr:HGGxSTG domain-containing protein [Candidatus Methylobacter favarea]CAA9891743.1 conserved hypothetical protein [Candidatus Methylobacter favarea]
MSTPEQRKRLKEHRLRSQAAFAEWWERDDDYPPPKHDPLPNDLADLVCGVKTQAGTPCKQKGVYDNGRCKWHGGCSTGPKTEAGKKRSAMNGRCPKKKRSHTGC